MLKLTIAFFLASAVPYCNKCVDEGDSCADSFSFSVVDKISGNDLVFGANAVYDQDSIYLTTTLQGYSGKMSYVDNNVFYSTLLIPVDTFYLKVSATDTDTLLMHYAYTKSTCCKDGRYGRVLAIMYNGSEVQKSSGTFILEK